MNCSVQKCEEKAWCHQTLWIDKKCITIFSVKGFIVPFSGLSLLSCVLDTAYIFITDKL